MVLMIASSSTVRADAVQKMWDPEVNLVLGKHVTFVNRFSSNHYNMQMKVFLLHLLRPMAQITSLDKLMAE